MRSFKTVHVSWSLFLAVLAAVAPVPRVGRAEDVPAGTAQARALAESLSEVQEQVRQLHDALREVQAEAARSRQEISELRRELQAARTPLTADRGAQAPATMPESSAPGSAPGAVPPGQALAPAEPALASRVAQLEENHQLLTAKIDDQYQTKVESGSKHRVRLSGLMLLNVFGNRGQVDNQDLPSVALSRGLLGSGGDFGATVRQTQLGLEVFGPKLGAARTSADVQLDFFGGFPQTNDGVTAGIVRMRTATARLEWTRTTLVVGQDAPFISPLSPTSLASVGLPAFSYAGNLWTWMPQIRIERRQQLSDTSSFRIQAGILDPLSGEMPYDGFYRAPQAGERSRQPAYATRLSWSRGPVDRAVTIGVGSYYSRQDWGLDRHVDAWAGTADWMIPFARWFSFGGEFYRGRALGGLGGGIGRSVVLSGPLTDPTTRVKGLNAVGGWAQLKFAPTLKLEFNGAFGQDNPLAEDLRSGSPGGGPYGALWVRNRTGFVNFIYRPRSNVLFSIEYRRLRTFDVSSESNTADHINLGMGVLF
jgi:hypothetical protein